MALKRAKRREKDGGGYPVGEPGENRADAPRAAGLGLSALILVIVILLHRAALVCVTGK